jgi:hypothetical protein
MKRLIYVMTLVAAAVAAPSANADIKDILNKVSSSAKSSTSTTSTTSSTSSTLSSLSDLVGSWKYSAPAVTFKSENLLKKAGGSAVATELESKMEPYYNKAGLNNMTITFASDNTFKMTIKKATLSGTATKNSDGNYTFNFKALGKIKTGSMTAYITKSGSKVSLTFDATKLITLIEKISSVSGNSSLKTLSSLLSSYDGLNIGFKLAKS